MKDYREYIQDISEMRSMMERSSKFLSLSGLSGVMAGVYALAGAIVVYRFFDFNPNRISYSTGESVSSQPLWQVLLVAILVLLLSVSTAYFLSRQKATKSGEKFWNSTAKLLVTNLTIPLIAGGLLILIFIAKGLVGFIAPFTLIFYGIAIFNAGKFTYEEMKSLGIIEIVLGLAGCYFVELGLLFWAIGFGVVHIIYGIYMHYRYER